MVAMALFTTGCKGSTENKTASTAENGTAVQTDGAVVGEGSTAFPLTIVDKEGGETTLEIHTDKTTVGEALTELGVITGEEGDYGLYVKPSTVLLLITTRTVFTGRFISMGNMRRPVWIPRR